MSLDEAPIDNPAGWVAEHLRRYLATNGEDGHLWRGATTLALTTLGRRSAKPRRTMLIYGKDADRYVVVASKGGAPEHPLWYENLVAHPEVEIQVLADRFRARARTAEGEERTRLWKLMTGIWPDYAQYQQKTSREIPVVVLERSRPT
ncbi:MAG: nitroreductase family deazaflavin-dependent oxidoreductase [Chloroflexota bacterium]